MTLIDLEGTGFPALPSAVHAKWAPVILEPIAGSYDRLVIGCAVVNDAGYHLEMANALQRLRCLYDKRGDDVAFLVRLTTEALEHDLAKRGLEALESCTGPFSGVHIGDLRDAEGNSLEAIGRDWMSVLSSLYDPTKDSLTLSKLVAASDGRGRGADRLPQLVLDEVSNIDLGLVRHFSERVVSGGRSRRSAAHKVDIDYKGRRLVANFATLNAGRIAPAVGNIKQRLWDLKIDREEDFDHGKAREHELIVQVPRSDDPQLTVRQYDRLKSEYEGLVEQADALKLILREFNTAQQIGKHIVRREAA